LEFPLTSSSVALFKLQLAVDHSNRNRIELDVRGKVISIKLLS
jgi:hypothetical protein